MSIIVLSLLLVVLVAVGGLMHKQVSSTAEFFDNPAADQKVVVDISPALANLLETPRMVAASKNPQVNTLQRDQEIVAATEEKPSKKKSCPACPVCPDMSKYVRLDEVPCWNCTLP